MSQIQVCWKTWRGLLKVQITEEGWGKFTNWLFCQAHDFKSKLLSKSKKFPRVSSQRSLIAATVKGKNSGIYLLHWIAERYEKFKISLQLDLLFKGREMIFARNALISKRKTRLSRRLKLPKSPTENHLHQYTHLFQFPKFSQKHQHIPKRQRKIMFSWGLLQLC